MAKRIKNERCALWKECGRSCKYIGDELGCDYYKNNAVGDSVIPDQEELRVRLEAVRERLAFEAEVEALVLPEDEADGERKLVYLPVGDLHPHPDNPRKDLGDLSELAESIKAKGIMQNLTVVPRAEGGHTIIIGHRRHGAAALAGLSVVPCVIVDMTSEEQLQTMLLENVQRVDLTIYEQACAFSQLVVDFGQSVESVAKKTGFSETTVRRRLEIAKLSTKKLQEVSGRQLSFGDFEELAQIKDMKKRNEVLGYIGTHNFESELANALREEKVEEAIPFFLEKLKDLGAKEMKGEDRWSGKYEQISSLRMTDEGAKEKALLPKKYLTGEPLFYSIRTYWGDLEIYRKKPKNKVEKRSKAQILREKQIGDCSKALKDLSEAAKQLRANFIKSTVMHQRNRNVMLTGAAQVLCEGIFNYQYSISATEVLDFLGMEKSNEYGKNGERLRALLGEDERVVLPAVIYLCFENRSQLRYWTEVSGEFPKHMENERLDALYTWLCSLGYEMSDEELALQNGTHELLSGKGGEL